MLASSFSIFSNAAFLRRYVLMWRIVILSMRLLNEMGDDIPVSGFSFEDRIEGFLVVVGLGTPC